MKSASLIDLLQKDAQGVYAQWVDTLKQLTQITDPAIKKLWSSDLEELHTRAQELLDTELLNGVTAPMMKLITSRTAAQWIILQRNNKSIPI